MEEIAKNLLFQAGFAGLILLAAGFLFRSLMQYIVHKDELHERERKARDEQFMEVIKDNTKAMNHLTDTMFTIERNSVERHHATDKKLDQILGRRSVSCN